MKIALRLIFLGVCGAGLVALASLHSQETPAPPTLFRVLSPADKKGQVSINGKQFESHDAERGVAAPPLAKGQKEYTIVVSWSTNNYTTFHRTQKSAAMPGKTVVVDLRQADPKQPDHIEIRYVPTPDDVVERMCKLARVGPDDVVYDLGCGDGRIVNAAVENFKAKRGVGIDLDPDRIAEAKEEAEQRNLSNRVEFRVGDVLKIKDLPSASVVMLYMGDDVNLRLRPILKSTLKPGARVVSHRFGMGDWQPDRTETFLGEDGDEYTILLWTIREAKPQGD
jgi:SAM-dependent methyltransferase